MKKGISVIIPCYNVEKYLDRCLESIINQTYKNLEIILVDDCSKDNTWKLITKYTKKYDNIIGIKNKTNCGAGYSRNEALKIAAYDYISFIDSDDYIESNFYESMFKQMQKEKSDVVVCDIFVKYDNVDGNDTRGTACTNPNDKYSFIDNGLAASPCNKIFKKEQLLKYPFAEGIMNEDISTVLAIMIKASKISYNTDTYYNYIQRKSSVQNAALSDIRFDLFKALDLLEERIPINKKNRKYWDAIIYNQINMFLIYVIPKETNPKIRKSFLKKFNELSSKYNIRKNPLWWTFLACQGRYHKLYYRMFVKLTCEGYYSLANQLISFYRWYSSCLKKSVIKDNINMGNLVEAAKKQQQLKNQKNTVSVVIPNYNYEKFMFQRIYSILTQTVKIEELIILDDCSKDNSRELIDKIEKNLNKYIKIKKVYNEENSGSAFKQWQKGFSIASGDYIWIAEADDYCEKYFLANVMKPMKKHSNIVLSYADTAFIDKDGYIIMKTIKPEIDILKTGHWNNNFVNDGIDEIKNYAYLNCTIANVSSVLFKNDDYSDAFKKSGKFKQAGDWLFYIIVMSRGKIAFCNKAINYYRVHGNNVTSNTKKKAHLEEIKKIHSYYKKTYGLNKEQEKQIKNRYKFLERVWNLKNEE